jgi:hypothetical protein
MACEVLFNLDAQAAELINRVSDDALKLALS